MSNLPDIDVLIAEAQRLMDIQKQIEAAKKHFRDVLEIDGLDKVFGSWDKLLELLDNNYSTVIDHVTDQNSYDKIAINIYDTGRTALEIAKDMRNSKAILAEHTRLVKSFAMCTCPYCGNKFNEDFAEKLEKELKKSERLEWFYLEYYKRRFADRKRLVEIAEKKHLDVNHWKEVYETTPKFHNKNLKGDIENGNEA